MGDLERHDPGQVVILGAGPTGLGAGYRLRELGHERFRIVDQHEWAGGLARSFVDQAGFTWDIGGHVVFSHYDYYDRVFAEMMGEEYTLNDRESWIRALGRWVPYPFQNNIRYLPPEATLECLLGLIRAQSNGRAKERVESAADFGQFIDAVFGEGIARVFMRPYNEKVWAHPPEQMNKHWIGERVAVIDVERAVRNVVLGLDDFGWGPNNRFRYPLRGGTGEFYRRLGESLDGYIDYGRRVVRIEVDRRRVVFSDGSELEYESLISAMPLDVLCRDVLTGDVPEAIRDRASGLKHSSVHAVGVGIARPCPSRWSWMYFPEGDCPFYRVSYLSNYSPHMTPDGDRHYSLLCETSSSRHRPVDPSSIEEETIAGLERVGMLECGEREDIVSVWRHRVEYGYPTPSVDRDEILGEVIPWLESRGIYSRGRFGMWKYEVSNTDHTLMQGVEAADRLVTGKPEQTIGLSYRVTRDGRRAAEHERPGVAGSGEKRAASSRR